jgi:hypothetical protein
MQPKAELLLDDVDSAIDCFWMVDSVAPKWSMC